MYEALITFLIFVGVIAVTAVVFCAWIVVAVVRGLVRVFAGVLGMYGRSDAQHAPELPPDAVRCQTIGCRKTNPARARFCRRCGRSIDPGARAHAAPARRAAVW